MNQMNRKQETRAQPWGTLEELLLACAVHRHGTKNWESIAIEVQNRSSGSPSFITPQDCKNKFNDLKRRFMTQNDDELTNFMPMVDELKRVRVEELRRDVERQDVSIVSLEMKVKRLEEERRRSLKEEKEMETDLKDTKRDENTGETKKSIEYLVGKSLSGESSENRSFNESNSMSQKNESQKNLVQFQPSATGNESEMARTMSESEVENDGVVQKQEEELKNEKKTSRASGLGDSNEVKDESNEVQSSTSLSDIKLRRKARSGAGRESSSCEEPEYDEVSRSTKPVLAVNPESLMMFLGVIRSHRLGSTFERRLQSQESERYSSLIRQHMDLHTIKSRLRNGFYSDSLHRFYHDVLLLFTNAIVFFRKSSPEHVAALELRSLVRKKMNDKLRITQPIPIKPEPKLEPNSLSKPTKSFSLVACGKRSSSKAPSDMNNRKLSDEKKREIEEKPKVDHKITKKNSSGGVKKHAYGGNELSSHDGLEVKTERKEISVKKKQGAANFLKRMKQNVDDENGDVSDDESENEEEGKKRGSEGKEREWRGERVTRSCNGGRGGGREENGRMSRGVGRPPKRPESLGKRGRENSEEGVGGSGGRARKRSRRR